MTLGKKETILDISSMIVTETNEKGIITFVSEDFCKIAEYSQEELVGKPHNVIRHDFMPKQAFKDLWSTVKSGNIWRGIVVNKTKNDGYYWTKALVFPSQNSDGSKKYISIRVKPSQKDIDTASALYKTL